VLLCFTVHLAQPGKGKRISNSSIYVHSREAKEREQKLPIILSQGRNKAILLYYTINNNER